MDKRLSTCIVSLILFFVVTAMMLSSFSFAGKEKSFPLLVGTPVWIALFYLSINDFRKFMRAKSDGKGVERKGADSGGEPAPDSNASAGKLAKVILLLVVFVALIYVFGFYIATIGFTLLFFAFYGGAKWWTALIIAAGLCISIFLLAHFVQVEVYKGVVFGDKNVYW